MTVSRRKTYEELENEWRVAHDTNELLLDDRAKQRKAHDEELETVRAYYRSRMGESLAQADRTFLEIALAKEKEANKYLREQLAEASADELAALRIELNLAKMNGSKLRSKIEQLEGLILSKDKAFGVAYRVIEKVERAIEAGQGELL